MFRKYCIDKGPMGCNFYVYYKGNHNGGGPLFIKHIFSTKEFLNEHKDCKSVLEVCSGPGFIGWFLYRKLKMNSAHFSDIFKPLEDDLRMTCNNNNEVLNFYHSDGFKNYDGPKVDLIVMNPPFYNSKKQFEDYKKFMGLTNQKQIKNSKRILLDLNYKMHDNLIENYDKHLTDSGRIVFLQDLNAFPKKNFLKKYKTNTEPLYNEYYVAPEYFNKRGEMVRMKNSESILKDVPNFYTLTYYKN